MNKESYWEKSSTKRELMSSLNRQRSILNPKIVDYLTSLMELEFSVLRKNISNKDRKILADYLIYRKIAMYNIYHRALNVIKESGVDFEVLSLGYGSKSLKISLSKEEFSYYLFNFKCKDKDPSEIGNINLYQLDEDMDALERQRNNLIYEITKINKQSYERESLGCFNYMGTDEYNKKMYQEMLTNLEKRMKNGLPKERQEAIKVVNYIHDLLLDDYGLTLDDFKEVRRGNEEKRKILVYNSPNLTVTNIKNHI